MDNYLPYYAVPEQKVLKFFDLQIKRFSDGKIVIRKYDKVFSTINSAEKCKPLTMIEYYTDTGTGQLVESVKKSEDITDRGGGQLELFEIRKDSLSRTRRLLIDIVWENRHLWKSFITLTFADNVTDVSIANKKFQAWITNIKKIFRDLLYVAVPEFQKRGAVHYHILTNIPVNSEVIPKRKKKRTKNNQKGKCFDMEYYDLKYWSHGFSSAFDLEFPDDHFNVASYVTKYLYKDISNRLYGHQKILHSNGLALPKLRKFDSGYFRMDLLANIMSKYDVSTYEFKSKEKFQVDFKEESFTITDESDLAMFDLLFNAIYK